MRRRGRPAAGVECAEPGRPAVVVGMGSFFRGDDAVGFEVVEAVRRRGVPPGAGVELAPGGGLDAVDRLRGSDLAVVVDAVVTGAPPGTVRHWDIEELAGPGGGKSGESGPFPSTHGLGFLEALAAARRLEPGALPRRLVVVGVEAGDLSRGRDSLSSEVARAVPRAAALVLKLLGRGGAPPARRGGGASGAGQGKPPVGG